MGESGVWSYLTCLMGFVPGGPLHSDGSGSSKAASVYRSTCRHLPSLLESYRPKRRRVLPVSGIGLMICRSVCGRDVAAEHHPQGVS